MAGDDRRDRGEGGLPLLSGLIALVFTRLGTRAGSATGVAGYTAAGLGPRAGQAAAWCFLAGVVTGAPVVCLIGGAYVAELLGAGGRTAYVAALCLLVLVLAVRLGGVRTGTGLQLVLGRRARHPGGGRRRRCRSRGARRALDAVRPGRVGRGRWPGCCGSRSAGTGPCSPPPPRSP
ncbi:amino acid permease [Streptomyces albidoflavus]|uniref:amino acid permease n=1 Tax=Streptomyces albidoflavus TaxID=1886 RepID=UPI00332E3B06